MKIVFRSCQLLALLLCLAYAGASQAQVQCAGGGAIANGPLDPAQPVGNNNPTVNWIHIFCGEVRYGVGKGWHSRPGNADPVGAPAGGVYARGTMAPHLANAIYRGDHIDIYDAAANAYRQKPGFSTFFPDQCSVAQVKQSIAYAYANRNVATRRGPSSPLPVGAGYCLAAGAPFQIFLPVTGAGVNRWLDTAYP